MTTITTTPLRGSAHADDHALAPDELLFEICLCFVTNRDRFSITSSVTDNVAVYTIAAASQDVGKLVGQQGRCRETMAKLIGRINRSAGLARTVINIVQAD